MPKRSSSSTGTSKASGAKRAQTTLVEATARLNLPKTQALCGNAAMHADLPGFLAALSEAMALDADRMESGRNKEQAKAAGLPFPSASVAQVETGPGRGVVKLELDRLAACSWIRDRQSLLITGPTQAGKSYLASALARAALQRGHDVVFRRTTDLLREWHEAQESREAASLLRRRVREADLVVLDDFGEGNVHQHDLGYLRNIVTERFDEDGKSLCVVTSGDEDSWREWLSDRDEARAIAARITGAYIKVVLLRGPKRR